jgi:hypothetical protein
MFSPGVDPMHMILAFAYFPFICIKTKTSVGVLGMPKTPLNSIRGHISCPNVLTHHLQSNKDYSKPSGSKSFTWKKLVEISAYETKDNHASCIYSCVISIHV